MEISNEMRARIFAAYIPCQVLYRTDTVTLKAVGITIDEDMVQVVTETGYVDWYSIDGHKLALHDLKNITDEHLVKCYHLYCEIAAYDYTQDYKDVLTCAKHWLDKEGMKPLITYTKLSDTLRSLGYDVGYQNIPSLIEARIAIDVTKTETDEN